MAIIPTVTVCVCVCRMRPCNTGPVERADATVLHAGTVRSFPSFPRTVSDLFVVLSVCVCVFVHGGVRSGLAYFWTQRRREEWWCVGSRSLPLRPPVKGNPSPWDHGLGFGLDFPEGKPSNEKNRQEIWSNIDVCYLFTSLSFSTLTHTHTHPPPRQRFMYASV